MSLKKKIAHATQNNYRLNCRVLKMKHSWDEVQTILDTACRKKRKGCHSSCHCSCEQPQFSHPKPSGSCSCQDNSSHKPPNSSNAQKHYKENCTCQNRQANPRSPFYR